MERPVISPPGRGSQRSGKVTDQLMKAGWAAAAGSLDSPGDSASSPQRHETVARVWAKRDERRRLW